jgi:hypothetical protein
MRKRARRKELRNRRGQHEAIACSVPTQMMADPRRDQERIQTIGFHGGSVRRGTRQLPALKSNLLRLPTRQDRPPDRNFFE